ncbi:MAG: glyoxylase-like metal-dependent hydrolase (beta-lactamase superfamily II) [Saprospiraceae bacterium]|jgi:glyoxylase-like metal-dependent hydrolase (beta-lactamase superfamily II)
MSLYTVHTIDLNFLGHENGIAAFLVETSEGTMLVETGPHSTFPVLKSAIEAAGHAIEDIKHVLLTHIHLDHGGAAWCFAELGATVYLHPKGYRHMHQPERLLASAKMIYKENMDRLWGTLKPIPAEQLVVVEDQETLNLLGLNIKALHTPGHAKHHIAWRINDVIFTGDVAGVSINQGPVIPPCPPPDINIEDWNLSIATLRAEKDILGYYLTHFGYITDTEAHLQKLEKSLKHYSEFMKPYAEAQKTVEEVLPEFQEFVRSYLLENGLNESDTDAYQAANPADMSATGLLRYWHKKNAR